MNQFEIVSTGDGSPHRASYDVFRCKICGYEVKEQTSGSWPIYDNPHRDAEMIKAAHAGACKSAKGIVC